MKLVLLATTFGLAIWMDLVIGLTLYFHYDSYTKEVVDLLSLSVFGFSSILGITTALLYN